MKAVELLVNSVLPADLRGERTLDKKSLDRLMADIAQKYPDRYTELSKSISDIGRQASYLQGETITLADMRPPFDKEAVLKQMDQELDKLGRSGLEGKKLEQAKLEVFANYADRLEKLTTTHARANGNNLASAVISGARGNATQLKAMITTPALYEDYKGRAIPLFVRRSFGEGLRPAEYLASTFGVRKSVISTKAATAKAGDVGKQLQQAVADIVVTEDDCGSTNGIDVDTDDPELMGRVLARSYGGVKAGTAMDKKALSELRRQGVKSVLARSPLTCQSHHGVCAHDVGVLPSGHFPSIGEAVGMTSAQSVAEPLAQGSLNCLMEGTLVRMADGAVKPIETISPGEWVLGSDLEGHTGPVQVTHVWDQGMQPVQRYTFRQGSSRKQFIQVECTEEHPLLVNSKSFVGADKVNDGKLQKLRAGHRHRDLALVLPSVSNWQGIAEAYALWLGIYLGDGIRCGDAAGLRFSCADPQLITDLNRLSRPLNLNCVKRKRSHDWGITVLQDAPQQDMATGRMQPGYRNPLKLRLQQWGLLGKYAHEKFLPAQVWAWDQTSVAALIAGFIATDGCVYRNQSKQVGVSFASTSKPMLQQLKELLAVRLCVHGSGLTKIGNAGEGNRTHDMWQFAVNHCSQVSRLQKALPPIPGVKGPRFATYMAEAPQSTRGSGFYRCRRLKVEELGMRHCWDLTVDHPAHMFVLANQAVVGNTKHTGGAFRGKKQQFSGFAVLNEVLQSPENFPYKAAIAEVDGKVHKIEDAPQGGKYIFIGDQKHYALPGYDVLVHPGDEVEAGDTLSEGLIDAADIARLRGLGEARQAYVKQLKQVLEDSGVSASSRNLEAIARGTLDHVRIDDPEGLGNFLPDDLASYNTLSAQYSPPKDATQIEPKKAVGHYLQQPALHYTIGTRITPRIAKHLTERGMDKVLAAPRPPGFVPEMARLRGAQYAGEDWLAKMHTSFLGPNLKADAARGRDTNLDANEHFAPRLMIGKDFGKHVHVTGKF